MTDVGCAASCGSRDCRSTGETASNIVRSLRARDRETVVSTAGGEAVHHNEVVSRRQLHIRQDSARTAWAAVVASGDPRADGG